MIDGSSRILSSSPKHTGTGLSPGAEHLNPVSTSPPGREAPHLPRTIRVGQGALVVLGNQGWAWNRCVLTYTSCLPPVPGVLGQLSSAHEIQTFAITCLRTFRGQQAFSPERSTTSSARVRVHVF